MTHNKQICDVQPEDVEFLKNFEDELRMLTGMIEEMFVTNSVCLLSPVMRDLMIEKGRKVESMHDRLRHRLVIDNPGRPLH